MSYEIELVLLSDQQPGTDGIGKVGGRWPNNYQLSELATLSGLNKADIWQLLPERLRRSNGWRGRDYIEVAELLGFNTTPRFVKFEEDTPWPCLLRLRLTKEVLAAESKRLQLETGNPSKKATDYWYTVVYNQGHVYEVSPAPGQRPVKSLEDWLFDVGHHYRITSMLSFYLSEKLVFTAKDF